MFLWGRLTAPRIIYFFIFFVSVGAVDRRTVGFSSLFAFFLPDRGNVTEATQEKKNKIPFASQRGRGCWQPPAKHLLGGGFHPSAGTRAPLITPSFVVT